MYIYIYIDAKRKVEKRATEGWKEKALENTRIHVGGEKQVGGEKEQGVTRIIISPYSN